MFNASPKTSCRLLLGGLGLFVLSCQAAAPVSADPPGGKTGWTQTFDDEFNSATPGSPVNGTDWIPQAIYYPNGDLNNPTASPNYLPGNYTEDFAYYVSSNVTEDGSGFLDLTSLDYGAPQSDWQTAPGGNYGPLRFSSADMISRFQQAYGYYEVSMKPATTGGLDPTFWIVHDNSYPEIDIAEFPSGDAVYNWGIGPCTGGSCVNQGVLSGGTADGTLNTSATPYTQGFHTYGLDWEPSQITFYLDGQPTHTTPGGFPVPSDPMNLLLSVQMQSDTTKAGGNNPNGSWFGDPTQGTYPQTTQVDYVRVWQKTALLPYGAPRPVPGTVQAEDYDVGGEGIAYHDSDPTNNGGQYRPLDGVDTEDTYDTGGGYDVGWTGAGEWLKYTVKAATAGVYAVSFRVASPGGGSFHLQNTAGAKLTGLISVPSTGGYQTWATTKPVNLTLKAGVQTLELYEDTGGYNFNFTTFTRIAPPAAPMGLAATPGAAGSAAIKVSWTAPAGATGYGVYRALTSGGTYARVGTPTATLFNDKGLTSGTTYFYKVNAKNSGGTSALAGPVSATAP